MEVSNNKEMYSATGQESKPCVPGSLCAQSPSPSQLSHLVSVSGTSETCHLTHTTVFLHFSLERLTTHPFPNHKWWQVHKLESARNIVCFRTMTKESTVRPKDFTDTRLKEKSLLTLYIPFQVRPSQRAVDTQQHTTIQQETAIHS